MGVRIFGTSPLTPELMGHLFVSALSLGVVCGDGADVLVTTLPAGETRFLLPLYLPETMHINVQAHSNIYAQGFATFQDRWGQQQSTCIVSEMRCMVRTLPTVTRLQSVDRELTFAPDGTASCRLHLD